MDSFGRIFRINDEGDTHGTQLSGTISGIPAGIAIDLEFVKTELQRRAPSSDANSTQRHETDEVQFLAGLNNNITTGEPILYIIPNKDVRKVTANEFVIKPSHASFTYMKKYGIRSNEDCGRASARQTVCRVVAGAIAKCVLRNYGIEITSELLRTGHASREGDTFGALVKGTIHHAPAGLGEPVYDKFEARLASAMLSINAAKGFEIGAGYTAVDMCGSEYNDIQNPDFSFNSNHDGGVQAGITNGEDIVFTVAFKPIPTLQIPQQTIDFDGNPAIYTGNLRNDRCVAPRVLPVVEAMAAIVTLDFILIDIQNNKSQNQ